MDVQINEITKLKDILRVEEIQKDVWGYSDREIVPWRMLILHSTRGGILLGAFEGENLTGFVFGFPAMYRGEPVHYSQMLGILPQHENRAIGFRLKMAQKEKALGLGYRTMIWTFDPLQTRNAYLNIEKLGAVSNEYLENLYGEVSNSRYYAGLRTDRLVARWHLEGERAKQRPGGKGRTPSESGENKVPRMNRVKMEAKGFPESGEFQLEPKGDSIGVAIPGDIQRMKKESPALARDWQNKLGRALPSYFQKGFTVTGFFRERLKEAEQGIYLLEKNWEP